MAVLVYLAEARGAVVSRNAIFDAVWPRMAVTADALSQCLVELRRAFDDDAKNPRAIETIPKIGVRLMLPVSEEPDVALAPTVATAPVSAAEGAGSRPVPAPSQNARPIRFARQVTAALAATVTAAVILWSLGRLESHIPPSSPTFDRRAIAVLPLTYDDATDDRVRMFADALHDELMGRLAKVGALAKVMSRTAVVGYRGSSAAAAEIGRELGVGTILEGRVHAVDGSVRINVELVDTQTSAVLWSGSYSAHLTAGDFFAVQSELSVAIAAALDATLSEVELARLRDVPTTNTRAHDFYVSGNEYSRRLNEPEKFLPLMVQQYTRATEEDPGFAAAWARLGTAHTGLYWYGIDRTAARSMLADAAIRTALGLAPALAEARVARADYLWRARGDHEGALAELAAVERDLPNDANLYYLRGSIHMRLGNWDLSIADHDKALELDPRNLVYLRQQSLAHMFKRDHASVARNLDRILEIAPDDGTAYVDRVHLALYARGDTALARRYESSPPSANYPTALAATYVRWLAAVFDRDYARALSILDGAREPEVFDGDLRNSFVPLALIYARTHLLMGDREEALRQFRVARSALELRPTSQDPTGFTAPKSVALAEILVALGDPEGAATALAQMAPVADRMQRSGVQLATALRVWLPLGDQERALQALDEYLGSPGRWTIEGLSADPRLDALKAHPRFAELVAKYGVE